MQFTSVHNDLFNLNALQHQSELKLQFVNILILPATALTLLDVIIINQTAQTTFQLFLSAQLIIFLFLIPGTSLIFH
jgi:hypothetical protein